MTAKSFSDFRVTGRSKNTKIQKRMLYIFIPLNHKNEMR